MEITKERKRLPVPAQTWASRFAKSGAKPLVDLMGGLLKSEHPCQKNPAKTTLSSLVKNDILQWEDIFPLHSHCKAHPHISYWGLFFCCVFSYTTDVILLPSNPRNSHNPPEWEYFIVRRNTSRTLGVSSGCPPEADNVPWAFSHDAQGFAHTHLDSALSPPRVI